MVGGSSGHSKPRRSWAAWHEPERDGAEQRCFREARRQLDADARDVFDHARADLDQASRRRPPMSRDTVLLPSLHYEVKNIFVS